MSSDGSCMRPAPAELFSLTTNLIRAPKRKIYYTSPRKYRQADFQLVQAATHMYVLMCVQEGSAKIYQKELATKLRKSNHSHTSTSVITFGTCYTIVYIVNKYQKKAANETDLY